MDSQTIIKSYLEDGYCMSCGAGHSMGEDFGDFCKCWVSEAAWIKKEISDAMMKKGVSKDKAQVIGKLAMMSAADELRSNWKKGPKRSGNFSSL